VEVHVLQFAVEPPSSNGKGKSGGMWLLGKAADSARRSSQDSWQTKAYEGRRPSDNYVALTSRRTQITAAAVSSGRAARKLLPGCLQPNNRTEVRDRRRYFWIGHFSNTF